jgi:hypothetical protein
VELLCEFGEEPSPIQIHQIEHLSPTIDNLYVQELPIIKPSSLNKFFIEPKSHRANDPKFRVKGDAGSTDIPRILWDFRLEKNHVERRATKIDFGHNGPLAICKIGYNFVRRFQFTVLSIQVRYANPSHLPRLPF